MFCKSDIVKRLVSDVCVVIFTKRDGSTRKMICTMQESFLPPIAGTSAPKEDLVTVWDLEKDAWRSFRVDSVLELNTIEEKFLASLESGREQISKEEFIKELYAECIPHR